MKKTMLFFTLLLFVSNSILAQVGINTDNSVPDASAMLDVKSTTRGLLIPRMTASERDAIGTPATGLTVFVTDDNAFYYFDGTTWVRFQETGKSWLLNGNGGTTGAEFLGTTDAHPLIFKTNNVERMQIKDNGVIGINTAPYDDTLIKASGDTYGVIASFESTRTSSDDIAVLGQVATTDYYGYGGKFIGGYTGVKAEVHPTGGYVYYGFYSSVYGGTGTNYGKYSFVNGSGVNYGTYNTVLDDSDNATNYGSFNELTGNNKNYGFVADLSGTGENFGFFGYFDVVPDQGSIAIFANSNADGTGLYALGGGITTYYIPSPGSGGAAIAATGDMLGIGGYTEKDDDNAICIEGSYQGDSNTDATGVLGYSAPADAYGYGVKGIGGWMGIFGETDDNGYAGVYGNAPVTVAYAVFANGDSGASGTKSFVIDHPQDPENKYLKHFSIESNEVLNVYRGVVTLDANGKAVINLPSYFKVINKNYSYQLTPIGSAAPGLYVSKEINNRGVFKIAGGQAGQKISWTVYAERNDPYLQQHPEKRQVEVLKRTKERGKYLMPELYKQPASKAMVPIHNVIKRTKKMQIEKLQVKSPEKQDKKYHQTKRITNTQTQSNKK